MNEPAMQNQRHFSQFSTNRWRWYKINNNNKGPITSFLELVAGNTFWPQRVWGTTNNKKWLWLQRIYSCWEGIEEHRTKLYHTCRCNECRLYAFIYKTLITKLNWCCKSVFPSPDLVNHRSICIYILTDVYVCMTETTHQYDHVDHLNRIVTSIHLTIACWKEYLVDVSHFLLVCLLVWKDAADQPGSVITAALCIVRMDVSWEYGHCVP